MADGLASELRLYCICGQKMKVSEPMFGLPGKCVACRQKIRVPTPMELPANTRVVYLKDHPEFLRKVQRPSMAPSEGAPSAGVIAEKAPPEEQDVTLGDSLETVSVAILDILEPLRVLCSVEHKIRRQLIAVAKGESSGAGEDQNALEQYLDRVRTARTDLDEQLRQRLMETAIELSSSQEKIIQAGVSARIGEIEFSTFRDTVDALRRRRDGLERLQQNLRGWLTVTDPHVAGGYTNVSLESIPAEGFEISLPEEEDDVRSLFDRHIEALREALQRRSRAELRLNETDRLKAEGSMSPLVLADCRADSEAERRRAEAEVTFRRRRLDELGNDYAADVQTIQACLERTRQRFHAGELDRTRFGNLEREMLRAQRDCAKVHGLITRALVASTPEDVPRSKGSFVKRMARPSPRRVADRGMDSWVAWASAVLFVLCVFLPILDDLSPVQSYQNSMLQGPVVHWVLILPIMVGVLVILAGSLPWRAPRGIALGLLWLGCTVMLGVLLHEAQYGMNPLAVRFRHGGTWFYRPGMVFLVIADLGVLASACLALGPIARLRVAIPAIIGAGLLILAVVYSNGLGYFIPRPEVTVANTARYDGNRLVYDVPVTVRNDGRRSLLVGAVPHDARNTVLCVLEKQTDTDEWRDTGLLKRNELRNVLPGRETVFRHTLGPGDYRARILSVSGVEMASASVSLPAPPTVEPEVEPVAAPVASAPPGPPEEPAAEPEHAASAPNAEPSPARPVAGVDVELRGVARSGKRDPRFSVIVYVPGSEEQHVELTLGDMLYDPWAISEFNPDRQTVTISDGQRMLILNRGERVAIN